MEHASATKRNGCSLNTRAQALREAFTEKSEVCDAPPLDAVFYNANYGPSGSQEDADKASKNNSLERCRAAMDS